MFPFPFIPPSLGITSWTLVGTTTGGGGTVTVHGDVQDGDIILVGHGDRHAGPSIGSGFTEISKAGNNNGIFTDSGISLAYKIADGTETTVSGWTGVQASWGCAVYRPNQHPAYDNKAQGVAYATRSGTGSVTITATNSELATISIAAMWDPAAPHATDYATFSADGNDPITGATQLQHTNGPYGITVYFSAQLPDSDFDILADSPSGSVHSFGAGYVEFR